MMWHLLKITQLAYIFILGCTFVQITNGKQISSGISLENQSNDKTPTGLILKNIMVEKQPTSYINADSEDNESEHSTGNSTDRNVWQGLAESVLCGTGGGSGNKAKAVRDALVDYDSRSNWVVFVTSDENGWAYSHESWEVLDKRSLCGSDLLVFRKKDSNVHCSGSLKEKIKVLIHSASHDANSYVSVRNLITSRESMFSLRHHVVLTFTHGSWASYAYQDCANYDDSAHINAFYYGYSTNQNEKDVNNIIQKMAASDNK